MSDKNNVGKDIGKTLSEGISEGIVMVVVTAVLFILFVIMFVVSLFKYNKSVVKFSIGNSLIYLITLLLFVKVSYNLYVLKND